MLSQQEFEQIEVAIKAMGGILVHGNPMVPVQNILVLLSKYTPKSDTPSVGYGRRESRN